MKPYYENESGKLYNGDSQKVLKTLEDQSVNCCVTSPPYWGLRDYGNSDQLGLEETPEEYVDNMVKLFRLVYNVLKKDGTLWLNLGDSYYNNNGGGSSSCGTGNKKALQQRGRNNLPKHKLFKIKDICGIPWRVAFALQEPWFSCNCGFGGREKDTTIDLGGNYCPTCGEKAIEEKGWYLRQDIIWNKPNAMPESVKDRCTKSHEYIFLLSKSPKYFYDYKAIREPASYDGRKDCRLKGSPKYETSVVPGKKEHTMAARGHSRWIFEDGKALKNKRSVWSVPTKPYKEAHFATFNYELISPCILAGCPEDGVVLDLFFGSGTTGIAAEILNRKFIGIELNQDYCEIASKRLEAENRQLKLF